MSMHSLLLPLLGLTVGPSAGERRTLLLIGSALMQLGLAGYAAGLIFHLRLRRTYAAIVTGCSMLGMSSIWLVAWSARYGPEWAFLLSLGLELLAYVTMGITLIVWRRSRRQSAVTC